MPVKCPTTELHFETPDIIGFGFFFEGGCNNNTYRCEEMHDHFSYVSVAVTKYHYQKQLGGERVYLAYKS